MTTMTRPDVYFTVYVSPIQRYHPCEIGQGTTCHSGRHCANCRYTDDGYEIWGENGHCQGRAKDRAQLAGSLRHMARKQWRMQDGRIMGYKIRTGHLQTYYA